MQEKFHRDIPLWIMQRDCNLETESWLYSQCLKFHHEGRHVQLHFLCYSYPKRCVAHYRWIEIVESQYCGLKCGLWWVKICVCY